MKLLEKILKHGVKKNYVLLFMEKIKMKMEKNKLILSKEEIEKLYNELNSLFDIVDPFPETLLSLLIILKTKARKN